MAFYQRETCDIICLKSGLYGWSLEWGTGWRYINILCEIHSIYVLIFNYGYIFVFPSVREGTPENAFHITHEKWKYFSAMIES